MATLRRKSPNNNATTSACSKRLVFSTEVYASDVRFFKTLQLDEARD
jgi:hypothetical protein